MSDYWALFYVESGERFCAYAYWPTEDLAEYMAWMHNEYVNYEPSGVVRAGRV